MLIDYLLILEESASNKHQKEFSPQLNLIKLTSLIINFSSCHTLSVRLLHMLHMLHMLQMMQFR